MNIPIRYTYMVYIDFWLINQKLFLYLFVDDFTFTRTIKYVLIIPSKNNCERFQAICHNR